MSSLALGDEFDPKQSIRSHTLVGVLGLLIVVGGTGGWAATTDISGALIAPGS